MAEEKQLSHREKLLRDTFTPAETALFLHVLITAFVAFWMGDPRSPVLIGFFVIMAFLVPVIIKTHELTHPFFITSLWSRFLLFSLPPALLILQFLVGLAQQPFESITFENKSYLQFTEPQIQWLPASTAAGATWSAVMAYSAVYISALSLLFVPKSRAFFVKLLPYLCLTAVIIGIFGYVQHAIGLADPLYTRGTGASDFFGFFPYDGHWAAFALLWTCACASMALLVTRHEDSPPYLETSGPWYLAGATILAASAFMVEAKWPAVFLMLAYSMMMLVFAAHFLLSSTDRNRKLIGTLSGLASATMLVAALYRICFTSVDSALHASLRQSAWEMFSERPVFGWGLESFGHALPFFGSDLLLAENYRYPGNDALQLLSELGIVGILPICAAVAYLFLRYLRGRHNIQLTNQLIFGLSATLLLSLVDSPFTSLQVTFSFLILLFIAVRWADVSRNKVDELDASKTHLIAGDSLRRVPFHVSEENDKLR